VSNFRPHDWKLLQSAMKMPLVTNQIEISLGAIDPFTNGDLAFHQRHGHHLMAWSPLGGGGLMSGSARLHSVLDDLASQHHVDRAAIAVAFLLAHPAGILPVMGTNNLDRIKRIGDALRVTLDRQTWFALYEAALGHEVA
jgi:predicted oxidoreductase